MVIQFVIIKEEFANNENKQLKIMKIIGFVKSFFTCRIRVKGI